MNNKNNLNKKNYKKQSGKLILQLKNVCKTFIQGGNKLEVLKNANLDAYSGEIVALIGPSGSGKSTLLHIAGLLDKQSSGNIFIDGNDCSALSDSVKDNVHKYYMGFVYQTNNLMNDFTALENVMMPLLIAGEKKKNASVIAKDVINMMKLSNRENHFPMQLSGGQQQRIAIARAIVNDPILLLADEPTGNLDPATSDEVFQQLLDIVKNKNLCCILATHNPSLAKKANRVFIMLRGCPVEVNNDNLKLLKADPETKELIKHFI